MQVLEGGGDRVSTPNGEVTLDLRTIIQEAADRIGIGSQVADKIPADAGRIVDPAGERARHRTERLRAPEDARLVPSAADARCVRRWPCGSRATAGARSAASGSVLVVVGILGLLAAKLTRNYVVDSLVAQRRRSAGGEQRVGHPHGPHARLVPADDRRRAPLRRRGLARRPGPKGASQLAAGSRPD